MAQPLEFYFDFSSPYGYLAAERIEEVAARHKRETVWKPFLLGAVFKQTGQAPLLGIPIKGDYARRDMERTARLHGRPLVWPESFPFMSVAAARAVYWLGDRDAGLAKNLALALFRRAFGDGGDISHAESVVEVAGALGVDRGELASALNDAAVKERLRREVETAIARGVFGSPFIFADGEPFWGHDRLDHVERWLETGGW